MIFLVIYILYYVVQIDNLEIRVDPLNQNGGSNILVLAYNRAASLAKNAKRERAYKLL
jgi:hypothetical protein